MNSSFEKKIVIHFVNVETNTRLWYSNAYSQPIRSSLFCQYALRRPLYHLQTYTSKPIFTLFEGHTSPIWSSLTLPPKPKHHPFSRIFFVEKYHSTLVASTLIILFSEMSKFSHKKNPNSKTL
jgi:hypothetical protein